MTLERSLHSLAVKALLCKMAEVRTSHNHTVPVEWQGKASWQGSGPSPLSRGMYPNIHPWKLPLFTQENACTCAHCGAFFIQLTV